MILQCVLHSAARVLTLYVERWVGMHLDKMSFIERNKWTVIFFFAFVEICQENKMIIK